MEIKESRSSQQEIAPEAPAAPAPAQTPAARPKLPLAALFAHHTLTPEEIVASNEIRDMAEAFAMTILTYTPKCADQTTAVRKIREAVWCANAAIALGGAI